MGVRHLIDATCADRLGLPVWYAVRDAGNPVRCHAGKGLTPVAAQVSAQMEALEHVVSECSSARGVDRRVPLSRLLHEWPAPLELMSFAPRLGSRARPRALLGVVECEVLGSSVQAALPADLVLLPAPAGLGQCLYGASSVGLASGNTVDEATLHALLEVLEHDAVALHLARDARAEVRQLPPPWQALATRWRRSGVRLHVHQMDNDCGLPCLEATLHEPDAPPAWRLARGRGAHPDRDIALARAVCEAAQDRALRRVAATGTLPGSDAWRERLGSGPTPAALAEGLGRLTAPGPRLPFAELPHRSARSVGTTLAWLLRRVRACGLGPVLRHVMPWPWGGDAAGPPPLQVVRVVVAGCETTVGAQPRMGLRLVSRLADA